jgi:hypothetical protein
MQNTVEVTLAKIDSLERLRAELYSRRIYLTSLREMDRGSECDYIAKMITDQITELKKITRGVVGCKP